MKKIGLFFILLQFYIVVNAGGIVIPPQIRYVAQVSNGVCTIGSIQEAIDMANPNDEIRIVSGDSPYSENLIINESLTIKGGYTSCGLAQLDSRSDENRTIIDGQELDSVLKVSGTNIALDISGIWMQNGLSNEAFLAGAMTISASDSDINLSQSRISNSKGVHGGGIGILASNSELTLSNTLLSNNEGVSGGGIYCEGNNTINVNDDSAIFLNSAIGELETTGFGGGIYSHSCDINLNSGTDEDLEVYVVGISNNSANNSGGGIYLNNGIINKSDFTQVSTITQNVANINDDEFGDGGGIYMVNNSVINLMGFYFNQNIAVSGDGGALYMNESYYRSHTTFANYESCILAGNKSCNLFQDNIATGSVFTRGGAIYMANNTKPYNYPLTDHITSNIRARFVNNRADGGSAVAIYSGSDLRLQNSYMIGNGNNGVDTTSDFNVIRISGADSKVEVISSTLANNNNSFNFALFNGAVAEVYNSIIYEQDAINAVVSPALSEDFNFDCSLFHEGDSIGPLDVEQHSLITTSPGFIDSKNGNYHLSANSPAVDRCHNENIDNHYSMKMDFDLDERPIDALGIDNSNAKGNESLFDAGADEMGDLIFKNGFE